jgi:hypothetical protein
MRGRGYLALVASDSWFWGGAYPSAANFCLAYNLHTGTPLNWELDVEAALLDAIAAAHKAGFYGPMP